MENFLCIKKYAFKKNLIIDSHMQGDISVIFLNNHWFKLLHIRHCKATDPPSEKLMGGVVVEKDRHVYIDTDRQRDSFNLS